MEVYYIYWPMVSFLVNSNSEYAFYSSARGMYNTFC